jgi:hypothetical protein
MNSSKNRILFFLGLAGVAVLGALLLIVLLVNWSPDSPEPEPQAAEVPIPPPSAKVENGLDVSTGFIAEGDYQLVVASCTGCHSSKLVLQNRASREGWHDMIRWMQASQKLWDLGENEDKILDYLATHYGPEEDGRRANLVVEEWYKIQ